MTAPSPQARALGALRQADEPRWRATVRGALEAHGSIPRASAALGISHHTLRLWLAGDATLGQGIDLRRAVTRALIPAEAMRAAIAAAGGVVSDAARALGITPEGIEARLARDPSIWPDGVPRRRRARPPRETLAEIEALIAAHGGVAATARALGVTKQAISGRLHTARRRAG